MAYLFGSGTIQAQDDTGRRAGDWAPAGEELRSLAGMPPNVPVYLDAAGRTAYIAINLSEGAFDLRRERLWSVTADSSLVRSLKEEGANVIFSADGGTILTCYGFLPRRHGRPRLWSARDGSPVGAPLDHEGVVEAAISRDGKLVVTTSDDAVTRVWNARDGSPLGEAIRLRPRLYITNGEQRFSPDGKIVLVRDGDRAVRLWSVTRSVEIGRPMDHPWPVILSRFSPDGGSVLTLDEARTARLWRARDGSLIGQAADRHVVFSPDGRAAVVRGGTDDESGRFWLIDIWRTADATRIGPRIKLPIGLRVGAAFTPDGRHVLVEAASGGRFLRMPDGVPVGEVMDHGGVALQCAAFSPDAKVVVLGGRDGVARLWTVPDGKPVGRPLTHPWPVDDVAYAPDGAVVVTASTDPNRHPPRTTTVRIWRASDGVPGGPPLNHAGHLYGIAFSPDGRSFLTAGEHDAGVRNARLWRLSGPPAADGRIGSPASAPRE